MQVNDTYHPTETLKHGAETYWSCCYCLEWFSGFGNNPDTERDDDECCNLCNSTVVIPQRLQAMQSMFS